MAKRVQLRRGTATEHNTFTGAIGEVTVDTTNKTLRVHDGTTVGGFPTAAKANADGTISLIKKDGTSSGNINSSGLFNNTLTSTNTDQALTAAQGKVLNDQAFGVGQTWQDVSGSRSKSVTYTNTTGKPIQVSVIVQDISSVADIYFFVNGILAVRMPDITGGSAGSQQLTITVPSTQTYRLETANLLHAWLELR